MFSIRVNDGQQVMAADVAEPQPTSDQALLAVRASSVNRGELALINVRGAGWGPGQDVAGVVIEAAPDGSGPAAGTRVVGLAEQGAWSARVAVTASRLAVIPDEVDFATAATVPMAGLTALRTLRMLGSVFGRHVLVTGASGGVGRFQVQLAQLSGARVTALTRSGEPITGADVVTDPSQAELADAALESIGGDVLSGVLQRLRPKAPLVWFGSTAGQPTRFSIYDFIGHEGASIITFFSYTADPDLDVDDLTVLLDLVARGDLTANITATWPLSHAAHAVEQLSDGNARGKIVLITDPQSAL